MRKFQIPNSREIQNSTLQKHSRVKKDLNRFPNEGKTVVKGAEEQKGENGLPNKRNIKPETDSNSGFRAHASRVVVPVTRHSERLPAQMPRFKPNPTKSTEGGAPSCTRLSAALSNSSTPSLNLSAMRPYSNPCGGAIQAGRTEIPGSGRAPSFPSNRRCRATSQIPASSRLLLLPAYNCSNFRPLWMMQFRPPHRRHRRLIRRRRQ
jgi:hypothetical protein